MEWGPRFGALCIAQLVKYISEHPRGVPPDNMHFIGYSVGAWDLTSYYISIGTNKNLEIWKFYKLILTCAIGAHIAGLVANHLKPGEGKIGRITGLDPTIFFYSTTNSTRDLDKSDAHFVDVLHTGAGILGQWSPSGKRFFFSKWTTFFKLNLYSIIKNRSCRFLCKRWH